MSAMYLESEGVYFGRKGDGSVRILKLPDDSQRSLEDFPVVDGEYPEALFDHTIPPGPWCSAVAHCSKLGETGATFNLMDCFHDGREIPEEDPK